VKTRDCPNPACKHGKVYVPWSRAVTMRLGPAWNVMVFHGKAPVGYCGVCGGKGRVPVSLAN
jgi:hypothetical protein